MNQEQLMGLVRHALTVLGGALVAKGTIDESTMLEAVGVVSSLIGFVWSYWTKRKTA